MEGGGEEGKEGALGEGRSMASQMGLPLPNVPLARRGVALGASFQV
jgi:hypothetical protein